MTTKTKLDLDRCGLGHLKQTPLLRWAEADIERLLDAAAAEDIALAVLPEMPPGRVLRAVLKLGRCGQCARCCEPNPRRTDSPGVEVIEQELASIASRLQQPYAHLRELTRAGREVRDGTAVVATTRWLPLPCPFLSRDQHGCTIYEVRPVACRVHPLALGGDRLCVHVDCAYGRGVFRNVLLTRRVASDNPAT